MDGATGNKEWRENTLKNIYTICKFNLNERITKGLRNWSDEWYLPSTQTYTSTHSINPHPYTCICKIIESQRPIKIEFKTSLTINVSLCSPHFLPLVIP